MERSLILKKGTIVDSTIIPAPSSAKNRKKKRDPEAHQAKKGNTWHFGYKAHIGVDKGSGLVHTVEVTAANVHDVTQVPKLLRACLISRRMPADERFSRQARRDFAGIIVLISRNPNEA